MMTQHLLLGPPDNLGFDLIGHIISFEEGTATEDEVLALFSHLIRTGSAWTLQGFYGRTAHDLIESGRIAEDGTIL